MSGVRVYLGFGILSQLCYFSDKDGHHLSQVLGLRYDYGHYLSKDGHGHGHPLWERPKNHPSRHHRVGLGP
jgi:hypothetical protein